MELEKQRIQDHLSLSIVKVMFAKEIPFCLHKRFLKSTVTSFKLIVPSFIFESRAFLILIFWGLNMSGKIMGRRIVTGSVVKESYGTAKQQHTFTIEVLWCEGIQKLPTLYPLLVK